MCAKEKHDKCKCKEKEKEGETCLPFFVCRWEPNKEMPPSLSLGSCCPFQSYNTHLFLAVVSEPLAKNMKLPKNMPKNR